ncbi:MAG: hypothetical protein ABIT82_00790 [Ramlibacter sp.]
MNTESPPRWHLAAGQTAHVPVAAGSQLVVLAGRVRLEWPVSWMGEVAMRHSTESGEGRFCRFDRGGWVAIKAIADAEICLQPRAVRPARAQWTGRKAQA